MVNSNAVVTVSNAGRLDNNAGRVRDIKGVGVLGRVLGVAGDSVEGEVLEDNVLTAVDAKMRTRSVLDAETTKVRVGDLGLE